MPKPKTRPASRPAETAITQAEIRARLQAHTAVDRAWHTLARRLAAGATVEPGKLTVEYSGVPLEEYTAPVGVGISEYGLDVGLVEDLAVGPVRTAQAAPPSKNTTALLRVAVSLENLEGAAGRIETALEAMGERLRLIEGALDRGA